MSPIKRVALAMAFVGTGAFTVSTALAAPNSGEALYSQYCAMCHGKDGKGAMPGTTDLGQPNGPLSQSDKVVIERTLKGYKTMPAMDGQISRSQAQEILAYMRKAFNVPAGN